MDFNGTDMPGWEVQYSDAIKPRVRWGNRDQHFPLAVDGTRAGGYWRKRPTVFEMNLLGLGALNGEDG